jgi:GT2 family glycosyltransferase
MKIAVLLTCHNRKDLTLICLHAVENALNKKNTNSSYSIYLTDDGSSDGTSESVQKAFPYIKVLKGNGDLFWAGGMRNSWEAALKNKYDGYILLNDDTSIYENTFDEIEKGIIKCFKAYNKNGILVGSTKDKDSNKFTYGGSSYTNKITATYRNIHPNGKYEDCQLGNGNIMFIHADVVEKIGILSEDYIHGVADYDYTYRAFRNNIPVVVLPEFSGYCSANNIDKNEILLGLDSFKKRRDYLMSPVGLAFEDNLTFQKNNFPLRYNFVYIIAYVKILVPRLYLIFHDILIRKK